MSSHLFEITCSVALSFLKTISCLSLRLQVKNKMILDVISNDLSHKNDMFLQKYGQKTSFKNVTMVTKMLHVYISVTVPDRPIVAIIDR